MSYTCPVCDKICKTEQGLVQHTEMKHGKSGVHQGVRMWEDARRQPGELTTGAASCEVAYVLDDGDWDGYSNVWRCSFPGCAKTFSDRNGYKCHLASGAHEESLYRCQGCARQFRRLADLQQHTSSSGCSARTARQVRTFMHDATHQHLMLADRTTYVQHYEATLNFDGSARPNPGYAGWGFVLVDDCGTEIAREAGFLGYHNTNNQAEWEGLIQGMESAERHGIRRLRVKGDSELVIKQMKGEMHVHNPQLKTFYTRAKAAQREFLYVSFEHVYRVCNQDADNLANAGRESYRYSPY